MTAHTIATFVLGTALVVSASTLTASDQLGIYCLATKVTIESNAQAPARVQIWGVFSFMPEGPGDGYSAPQKGYLYYSCPDGKQAICTKEWADLKTLATSGDAAGFGAHYQPKGRLRKTDEPPAQPDPYPISNGVVKLGSYGTHPDVIAKLKAAAR